MTTPKKKSKSATRAPKKKNAKRKTAAAKVAKPKFFASGARSRGEKRKQFHVLLSDSEVSKLAGLTHKMKLTAAEVVRSLIMGA